MDNMKARGWVEGTIPGVVSEDAQHLKTLYDAADALVQGTSAAAAYLAFAVESSSSAELTDGKGVTSTARDRLWMEMESHFYSAIALLVDGDGDEFERASRATSAKQRFVSLLETAAMAIFDRLSSPDARRNELIRRRVVARYRLSSAVRGLGKQGKKLFELFGIPQLESTALSKSTFTAKRKRGAGS